MINGCRDIKKKRCPVDILKDINSMKKETFIIRVRAVLFVLTLKITIS
jgi:hypothetical protein